jgi:hypothetical protein
MRARPNLSGEQLVTEYLSRVTQASRQLPKGERMAFVARTKGLVDRELGRPGTRTDPARVSEVLARLGTPEDLVIAERTRIDRSWVKRRASSEEEGEAAAAALTGPLNRSLTPRRRLSPDAQNAKPAPPGDFGTGPVNPAGGSPGAGSRRPVLRSVGPQSTGPQGTGPQSTGPQSAGPRSAWPRNTTPRSGGPRSGGLRSAGSPAGRQDVPPRRELPPGAAGKAGGARGVSGNERLAATRQLARDNLLETIAILLLGLGGLILPYVFWPAGAIVALFSRLWDGKDKSLAITGPLLVTLAGSVLGALIIGGSGNVVVVYTHALGADFNILIRVGSVLTAAYLAWRVTQGPRVKVPPWQRVRRS